MNVSAAPIPIEGRPRNDEFIEGSFQLLADNGSHPFWHFGGEWCDVITPLIG